MFPIERLKELIVPSQSKIVFLVVDGLGGLPHPETGKTELETARLPNLDALAAKSICGLIDPIGPGITPGSGPSHLALFGYDPINTVIGRGVLETLGIDFDLRPGDVAVRGNFCTVDAQNDILDRRAGRIPTEKCTELCALLRDIKRNGVQLFVEPVREHRFVLVLRGSELSAELTETDPQQVGVSPKQVMPLVPQAKHTAELVNAFIALASKRLRGQVPANMILLRGFSQLPQLETMSERYGLKAAAIAVYPMYRGLAKLMGMEVLPAGTSLATEMETLVRHYAPYDFFYLHFKGPDSMGEDGNFSGKVEALEEFDAVLPQALSLKPDVLIVTGDHSSPSTFKAHSWHPVPFLLYSCWCGPDDAQQFNERSCTRGSLGRFPAMEIMPLALAHAGRLTKYGA